jgi:hypothetical protein
MHLCLPADCRNDWCARCFALDTVSGSPYDDGDRHSEDIRGSVAGTLIGIFADTLAQPLGPWEKNSMLGAIVRLAISA